MFGPNADARTQYAVTNLLAASWTLAEVATRTSGSNGLERRLGIRCNLDLRRGSQRACAAGTCGIEASERVKKFSDLSLVITLPEGQGLPGRVWNSKKPTWVYDVTRDPNFPRAPYAAAADLRGGFAFPLFFHGEIDGIMELFSHNVVEPDEDLLPDG